MSESDYSSGRSSKSVNVSVTSGQKTYDSEDGDGPPWGEWKAKLHDQNVSTSEVIGDITKYYYENEHFLLREEDYTMFIYYPSEGVYKPKAESYLKQDLTENLGFKYYDEKVKDSVMEKIGGSVLEASENIGNTDNKVCVENGVLDISNPDEIELEDHTPDYLLTSSINAEYDSDSEYPKWMSNLKEVMPSPHDREKFQEFAGYLLHHWGNPYNRALLLIGPTQSGKSVLLNVLEGVLGSDSVLNKSLQRLSNNRFAIHNLQGKYANIDADLGSRELKDTGKFKKLVAGDGVTAERKFKDPYDYEPTQKFIFSANQVPEVKRPDNAFYERWLFVEFPETINRKDRKPNLEDDLLREKSGILNWMLEGYRRLTEQSGFTGERSLDDKKAVWKGYGDSIDRFIQRRITETPANEIDAGTVYSLYRGEFADSDVEVYKQGELTRRLRKEFDITTNTGACHRIHLIASHSPDRFLARNW